MRKITSQTVTTAGILVVVLLVANLHWQLDRIGVGVTRVIKQIDQPPQSVTTETKRADGSPVSLMTVRKESEEMVEFLERHDRLVAAFKGK